MKSARIIGFIALLLLSCSTTKEQTVEDFTSPPAEKNLLFVGDMMFDWAVEDTIRLYDVHYPLKKIKPLFRSYAFVMANLETPITNSNDYSLTLKYIFKASPENAQAMKTAGITAVSLANNHAYDYGATGLLDTLQYLSTAGMLYGGAGATAETASLPVLFSLGTLRIAVLCYTQIFTRKMAAGSNKPGVNTFELKRAMADIKRYRFCDVVIINIHWGNEYFYYPSTQQIRTARALIDAGADAVIGHHPHIYQGIEIYNNKPIVYSLGNFLFGSIHEGINDNIACALYLSDCGKITSLRVYAVKGTFHEAIIQPAILNEDDAVKIFNHIRQLSEPLGETFVKESVINNNYLLFEFQ